MQVLCDLRPTFLKCNCQTPVYTIRKGLRKGDKEANESKDHYRGRS